MLNDPKKFNEDHFILFHTNTALSTPEGIDFASRVFSKNPDLHDKIQKQIETHNNIMNQHFNVTLGNTPEPSPYNNSQIQPPIIPKQLYEDTVRALDKGRDDYASNTISPMTISPPIQKA